MLSRTLPRKATQDYADAIWKRYSKEVMALFHDMFSEASTLQNRAEWATYVAVREEVGRDG